MSKKCICLLCLFWIFQGLSAASAMTVTDQAGRRVRINQPVNRVVTTFIPATLFALCADLGGALAGSSNKDGSASVYEALIDPEHPPVTVGNRSAGLNLETIFSLKPDLVIMYGQKDGVRLADHLTAMGLPAIVIMPESMESVRECLDLIGRAAGRKQHTDRVIRSLLRIESMMADTIGERQRPRVYYAASRLLSTVSGAMLQDEMIRLSGGQNVSSNTRGFFVTISREQFLSWNPDVVIASERLGEEEQAKLYAPEFRMIGAVQKRAVFRVPAETYWDFPSPLAMAGVLWMAGKAHPDLFPEDMVLTEIQRFYDGIFGEGFSLKHAKVIGGAVADE